MKHARVHSYTAVMPVTDGMTIEADCGATVVNVVALYAGELDDIDRSQITCYQCRKMKPKMVFGTTYVSLITSGEEAMHEASE